MARDDEQPGEASHHAARLGRSQRGCPIVNDEKDTNDLNILGD
jgi:hypothetical protein